MRVTAGDFEGGDQAVAAPQKAKKRGARLDGDFAARLGRRVQTVDGEPAVELGCGAAGVEVPRREGELAGLEEVSLLVEQYIGEHVANVPRCFECAGVVALGEEATATFEHDVDATSDANGQALYATRKARCVGSLCYEVEVVALD